MMESVFPNDAVATVAVVLMGLIALGTLGLIFRLMMRPVVLVAAIGILGWFLYMSTL
jgi:hypothetical protein